MALEQLGDSLFADGHFDEAESVLRDVLARVEVFPHRSLRNIARH